MFVVSLPAESADAAGKCCLWSVLLSTCNGRGSVAKGRLYISGNFAVEEVHRKLTKFQKDALALGEDQNAN